MLLRKPAALWIGMSLFVVLSITMTPLVSRLRHRSVDRPRTLEELGARVSQGTPPLQVIWQHEDWPESAMWVCVRPRSREQLWALCRHPEQAYRWKGIVFIERVGNQILPILEEFIRDNWGEYGMRVGPFVLFGDPVLLQRIRAAILDL